MENRIKGMATCKVCGRDFPLIAEAHYVSKEAERVGIAALAGGISPILWDSFDCPHCGCQNRMQQRNRPSDPIGQGINSDCEEDNEEICCCCESDACGLNKGEQR